MPGMFWSTRLNSPGQGPGAALATSAALTDVSPAPQFTLPAGFLQPGSLLRLTAWGVFSNTSTPTLLLGAYYGGVAGVALCATGATTTTTAASNWLWKLEATIECITMGATGTVRAAGHVDLGTSLTASTRIWLPSTGGQNTVTVDTTTAKAITVGAQWGTSSASNTTTCEQFIVESLGL